MVEPGRDDDGSGLQVIAVGGAEQPAAVRRIEPGHLDAQAHLETVMRGVVLQVADDVAARDPAAVAPGNAVAGQVRGLTSRVQMQPFVMAPPGRADRACLVDDKHRQATAL